LYPFAEKLSIKEEAGLVIQIADCIFSCDSINEEAMILKCKAHFEMGAHSLSKVHTPNFVRITRICTKMNTKNPSQV